MYSSHRQHARLVLHFRRLASGYSVGYFPAFLGMADCMHASIGPATPSRICGSLSRAIIQGMSLAMQMPYRPCLFAGISYLRFFSASIVYVCPGPLALRLDDFILLLSRIRMPGLFAFACMLVLMRISARLSAVLFAGSHGDAITMGLLVSIVRA